MNYYSCVCCDCCRRHFASFVTYTVTICNTLSSPETLQWRADWRLKLILIATFCFRAVAHAALRSCFALNRCCCFTCLWSGCRQSISQSIAATLTYPSLRVNLVINVCLQQSVSYLLIYSVCRLRVLSAKSPLLERQLSMSGVNNRFILVMLDTTFHKSRLIRVTLIILLWIWKIIGQLKYQILNGSHNNLPHGKWYWLRLLQLARN